MKKITTLALSLLLVFAMIFAFASCEKEQGSPSYVSIDINPSIELTVDENNNVISVYAANEDANILLYEEEGILGANIEDAIAKITEVAIELGYLDETNKVVGTTVSSENAEWVSTLQEKVNTQISATAKESGLEITTDAEGAYSLLRKLEQFKEKYPDNQAIQNLSVSKFKLALSASENGEITLEGAVELDDSQLIEMISASHKELEVFATDAYNKAKQEAFAIYDELSGVAIDGVYGEIYLKNITSHLTTAWYGHTYQMYKTSARGFDAIADTLVFVEKSKNYPLDDEQVSKIMNALALTDRAVLEDADGNVTVNSVYAYADKEFKNTPASAELEAMKAELDTALDTAESAVDAKIQEELKKYQPQIEQAIATSKQAMDLIISLLPSTAQTALEAQNAEYNATINELTAIFETGAVSQAKMRECADKMNELAEQMLAKIKEDLSDAELAEAEQLIESRQQTIATYRQNMENAIADVEATVKAELQALKAERIAQAKPEGEAQQ